MRKEKERKGKRRQGGVDRQTGTLKNRIQNVRQRYPNRNIGSVF